MALLEEHRRRALPAESADNLDRCLRCGLCREVCPAFRATGHERFSPRGRLALLAATLEGESFGAPFYEALDYCLACRACAERCPSGVAGDVLVLAARAAGLCRGGLPFFKSQIFRLALGRPWLMAHLSRDLYLAQRSGLLPLALTLVGLPGKLALPRLERRPFDRTVPAIIPAEGEHRGRVIYFVGCATNYFYPSVARAVVKLLTRAGYDVVIPRERRCCGVPALAGGDVALTKKLGAANVAALAGNEPIVVDCGSCGLALTYYYNDVLGIPGAASFKDRVKDITQVVPTTAVTGRAEAVAYHDPCHLARGMGVKAQPRALLAAGGEVREIEAAGAVTCCGGAGAYGLLHRDIYNKVGGERAAAIVATGAAVVATGCPACIFYLNDALGRAGAHVKARHTAEVLAGDDFD